MPGQQTNLRRAQRIDCPCFVRVTFCKLALRGPNEKYKTFWEWCYNLGSFADSGDSFVKH